MSLHTHYHSPLEIISDTYPQSWEATLLGSSVYFLTSTLKIEKENLRRWNTTLSGNERTRRQVLGDQMLLSPEIILY